MPLASLHCLHCFSVDTSQSCLGVKHIWADFFFLFVLLFWFFWGFFGRCFPEWRMEKVAAFVLLLQYQKIIDNNIIIFFKVLFLIQASVNYVIKICPVKTVDASAINTCRAAWGRHSIVANQFLSWKMYFLLKDWETVDSCASVNVMSKVCRANYSRTFITKQLRKKRNKSQRHNLE